MKCLLFCVVSLVFLFPLQAFEVHSEVSPNQVVLFWDAVDEASTFEVFLDGGMYTTIPASVNRLSIGSNEKPLPSNTPCVFEVSARSAKGSVLAYATHTVKTESWSGRYSWTNITGKDNDGKCRSLVLQVEDSGHGIVIDGIFDRSCRLFPMVEKEQIGRLLEYGGSSDQEISYRTNAAVFNTTGITPKTWKVVQSEIDVSYCMTKIQTKVGAISATTVSTYSFFIDDSGKRMIRFETKGQGMANWGMFKSPNPGEEGAFVFSEIEN